MDAYFHLQLLWHVSENLQKFVINEIDVTLE